MVIPSSGAVAFSTINGEFAPYIGSRQWGSQYYGQYYYRSDSVLRVFPSGGAFAFSNFYGTSPDDEWNCQCAACSMCGK